MSANITAASTRWRRTGCSVTSAVSSADRLTSKNACRATNLAVLGKRPSGLAHEPDRCPFDRLSPRGSHEQRLHGPRLAAHGAGAACRPLGRLDARRAARRRARARPGRGREHRDGRLARRDQARLPLARRSRQSDRVGRRAHGASRARARRDRRPSRRACARRSRPAATASPSTSWPSHRAWFSELGSETASADVDVLPRPGAPRAELPGVGRATPRDWAERVAAAHAEGYAVVAGAIAWHGGLGRRRPRALAAYGPGAGRVPGLPASAALSVGADGRRARAPAGRRRPAGVRRAGRASRGSTTGGSCSTRAGPRSRVAPRADQSSIASRSSIAAEDERAEDERDDGGDGEVDRRRRPWGVAAPERVAERRDRRRDEVAPAQHLDQLVVRPARASGSVAKLQRIGVRKNHGRSAAARMCSTSRKTTFSARDEQRDAGDERRRRAARAGARARPSRARPG